MSFVEATEEEIAMVGGFGGESVESEKGSFLRVLRVEIEVLSSWVWLGCVIYWKRKESLISYHEGEEGFIRCCCCFGFGGLGTWGSIGCGVSWVT